METIESRAELNLQYERDFCGYNLSDDMVKRAYLKGATEQKALDDDAMHAIVEEQVLKAVEKQKAIDIKQLKDWLKHNIVKYAGMFTEHFEDEDGRETIKVCPCVDAALYDDLEKAMDLIGINFHSCDDVDIECDLEDEK